MRNERGRVVAATFVEYEQRQSLVSLCPMMVSFIPSPPVVQSGRDANRDSRNMRFAQRRREKEIQREEDGERIDERDLVVIIGPELLTAYEGQEARTIVGFSYWCTGAPFLPRKGGASMRSCSAVMPARVDQIG